MSHTCFSPVLHILLPVVCLFKFSFLKFQASPFLHFPYMPLVSDSLLPSDPFVKRSPPAHKKLIIVCLLLCWDHWNCCCELGMSWLDLLFLIPFLWPEQWVSASALFFLWPFLGKGSWVWKQHLVRNFLEASWTSCREYFWLNFSICSIGIKLCCITWVVLQCLDIQWIKATVIFR